MKQGHAYWGVDVGSTGIRWARWRFGGGVEPVNGPGRGPVAAALSADEAIFRVVELPPLPKREASSALRWELQRILPFPVDEGIFDFQELQHEGGTTSPSESPAQVAAGSGSRRVRYAVSGGPLEAVDRRYRELRRLGVRPSILEPEWVTLWRSAVMLLLAGEPGQACAVIDLGASSTRLLVIGPEGHPVAFHRSPVGGDAIDRELVNILNTEPVEARRVKESELAEDLGPLAGRPILGQLAGEFARALRRARQDTGTHRLSVWAIGGGARWGALVHLLEEATGYPLSVPGAAPVSQRVAVGASGGGHHHSFAPDWLVPAAESLAVLDPRQVIAGALALWPVSRWGGRRSWIHTSGTGDAHPGRESVTIGRGRSQEPEGGPEA